MKVALLNIKYYPDIEGGAEVSTQKLAEALTSDNEVYVIADGEYTGKFEIINKVNVIRIPARIDFHNRIERFLTRPFKIQCYRRLKDALKMIAPDVLHTNNLHEYSVIVWAVAHELGIPIIHTLRDYTLTSSKRRHELFINKYFSNKVTVATAPSRFTLRFFIDRGYFSKSLIQMDVPNAIELNTNDFEICLKNAVSKSCNSVVRFAFLGRYAKNKGVDWLISVFDNIDFDAELHLYGKGELADQSIEIIKKNKRIYDHGFLDEYSLYEELKNIDVIVAPSLWDEPFGRVILDGYKNACPVIVTNRGGMPEVVADGETGLILKDSTDRSLTEALIYMNNREHIKSMLPFIRTKLQDYTVERQAKTFINIYNQAIEKSAG